MPRCQFRAPALRAGRDAAAARQPYHDEKMRPEMIATRQTACRWGMPWTSLGQSRTAMTNPTRSARTWRHFLGLLLLLAFAFPEPLKAQQRAVQLQPLGWLELGWDPAGLALAGDYAYSLSGSEGLEIIDIRNPETPILVGRYRLPSWSSRFGEGGRGIQIANQHAFIVSGAQGLRVVSLADPLRPEQVADSRERAFRANDVLLGNGLAVLSSISTYSENALQIFDVSQPSQPKWRSELKGRAAGWAGDMLMVQTGEFPARLEFYSLANPAQPKRLARIEADAPVQPASPSPVPAYVAWAGRMQVFDVADPTAPRKAFDLEAISGPGFGAADGNLLSMRSGRAVEFWDLATPLQPARLGSSSSSRFFGTPSPPPFVSLTVRQGLLFGTVAAGGRSQLMIWRTRIGLDPKFTFLNYSVAYTTPMRP